jgi:hypothetical protein
MKKIDDNLDDQIFYQYYEKLNNQLNVQKNNKI